MHLLDHLAAEPFGSALESLDERTGPLDLALARRERLMTGCDLVGMNQALAVKPEPTSLLRFGEKPIRIVKSVENPIERRHSSRARSKDYPLQCRGDRLAGRIERKAQIGTKIVGPRDQPRRFRRDRRRRQHAGC